MTSIEWWSTACLGAKPDKLIPVINRPQLSALNVIGTGAGTL